ncbi:ATP-grasp domain-containing protein [Lysinibacillus sp. LZ02]|uniref:ATP-grasp domain-containing protein n=1 Tax=Lysinibacillus sp. LZ02 TaxID=3420668 RepID=UPI003D36208A
MKRLLMLGGAQSQLSAIKKAREMGCYVIICDIVEDIPGKHYAHEFYEISTSDKEAILSLAESLQIDGIVCYAADSGAPTVAYVAEKLGLPSNPFQSVEILTNKEKFRQFQRQNGFNIPRARGYNSFEEVKSDFQNFKMPVMIKPVDSAGSKGVSKVDSIEFLEEKVKNALSYSKIKRFIIEEYIENHGPHVGGDGFSVNGKLVFRSFTNEYFCKELLNPFVPIITTWPYVMPKYIQKKIHGEIQRVLDLLDMKTGAYNFDIRIDENENVYLIEIAPRNGGDWNPEVIKYATEIDLIEYTIKAALGKGCSDLQMAEPSGYWASYVLNSNRNGVFKGLEIQQDFLEQNIVEYELVVQTGDTIAALSGSHEKLGLMILRFSSELEMVEKLNNINTFVKVNIEDPFITLS